MHQLKGMMFEKLDAGANQKGEQKNLLHNQADIRSIQMMLGHAWVATTEIYSRLEIDNLKFAHRRAHPHGRRDKVSAGVAPKSLQPV
jgi:hypothetical protein